MLADLLAGLSTEQLSGFGGLLSLAVLLTVCIAVVVARRKIQAAFEAGLTRDHQQQAQARALLDERLELKEREVLRQQGELAVLRSDLEDARTRLEQRATLLAEAQAERAALSARMEESERGLAVREAMFKESSGHLKAEFANLAAQIFEQQGQRHGERLANVLSPFKDQIKDFRQRVDQVYASESKDRASLLTEVRNLQQASERINQETENLTRALKGDKKLQGNWGELVLERVLEDSGLRKDHEYFLQESRRSAAGSLKRPDVLIRLPDEKDIVIDAKVSLNAYERALTAEFEADRTEGLKTHLANLRQHVRRLSEQNYDQLEEVRSLDFVLMFVPIESAFTLAMEADPRLFSDAFEHRIVLVSPTSLMMALRIIHNVWRYEKQNRNAEVIAERAGALYDKLRVYVEEFERLGLQLGTVNKTYDSAYQSLTRGRGNLVRQAEQFKELGARVKKGLPKKVVEDATDTTTDEPSLPRERSTQSDALAVGTDTESVSEG